MMGWLRAHDPDLNALRRAGRGAIVMPAMFALGDKVIGNPALATFAAFGSFSLLLLVDFPGPRRDRLSAQLALGVAGGVLVCLGTAASRDTWLAAVSMAIVGFVVIFAGVVSSVLASATVSLLLAFILSVSLRAPLSAIPDRLAGWGLALAASLIAITVLWPAPVRNPLRLAASNACKELADRLRGGGESPSAAVEALRRRFFATPYRPTGLSTSARAVVRLIDELSWLDAILAAVKPHPPGAIVDPSVAAVKSVCASLLDEAAALLVDPGRALAPLRDGRAALQTALVELESSTTLASGAEIVSSLDPSFRAQELAFAVSQIAANVELAVTADRRSFVDRALGRRGRLAVAQERAAGHLDLHSVWLQNSIRGAIALAIAVAIAAETGVQHSFWVVLGTLSVLRSNALSTGQNAFRAVLGTAAGFLIGAALLEAIGTDTTVLWILLPVSILVAGFAPAAISFAAGQAAFTVTLVILFNILVPQGWRVGLVRIEDVAIGCAVSLGVGTLLWPRGAAAALGQALTAAYAESALYLSAAVEFGLSRCDHGTPKRAAPTDEATHAAAAGRRLDDAFRTYLMEHGAKPARLAEATSLVTGVVGLRLAADAVLDLWERDDGSAVADRAAAASELLAQSETVSSWYRTFAEGLDGHGTLPEPLPAPAEDRLVDAVERDLTGADHRASAVAVRMIWTGDHVDAARRLQAALIAPARSLVF